MKILLLGGGGREHAMSYHIIKSPLCDQLYIAPGNAGTQLCGKNVELDYSSPEAVTEFCLDQDIDILLIGPEAPLVEGLVDHLQNNPKLKKLKIIGPGKEGARLEGSKSYAKEFMQKYGIPTAEYKSFDNKELSEAIDYVKAGKFPVVIKADGLAAGKGVIIAISEEEAVNSLKDILENKVFGDAGNNVVIEEFLDGREMSCFILTDGNEYYRLPSAKDYKRIGEKDTGPNTGGMGAVSPVDFITTEMDKKIVDQIIEPTLQGLRDEGITYIGFIFFGLIAVNGDPYVIEYNVRLGDPETEVILNRIENDFLQLLNNCSEHAIKSEMLRKSPEYSTTVMLVSAGYPGDYEKGKTIYGLGEVKNGWIFHAGTAKEDETIVTNGGRVLALSAMAPTLKEALDISYENAEIITFDGKYYRKDIGYEF